MVDKLDMKSMDIIGDNIAKIRALFPSAITEVMGDDGKVKLAIDFKKRRFVMNLRTGLSYKT